MIPLGRLRDPITRTIGEHKQTPSRRLNGTISIVSAQHRNLMEANR